jgi:hypothetical protein
MKRQVKRNMVSFEASSRDLENIEHARLKRGGISTTKLLRDLLEEDRGTSPVLTVMPAMAPPKDLKAYLAGMKALEETIEYVAETGLPNCYAEASEADRVAIDRARALFIGTLAQIDSEIAKYVLFGRMVAALERCNVAKIKEFAQWVKATKDAAEADARNPKIDPENRKALLSRISDLDGVFVWFSACGLLPPNS